ncbi:MAG TPA: MFS transporter [Burkholderiales bacterium]|nr:MFS transporter [Burkholderiales bacterium]
MQRENLSSAQTFAILGGAAVMLSLAMGMRQSWGLFQPHMMRDVGLSAADFSLAIAIQNIMWGLTQPFVGALADRYGMRPVVVSGALIYAAGLALSLVATSPLVFTLGAGICIGTAMSCVGASIAVSIASRTVSPAKRSLAMGAISGIGSLGLTFASPLAQSIITTAGWQMALVVFVGLAVVMLPAAWLGGGCDRIQHESFGAPQTVGQALTEALRHPGYVVMALAYFVCGLQLVFLTTHLPNYLELCGMGPAVGASALALIGLFNVFGSFLFGWLGGRYSRRALLGGIYILRSLIITAYFMSTPTPLTTLLFAAAMGTLWLGVVPLVSGLVIQLFGLRYMATIVGIAFFSHQLGSFVGALGGGLVYSWMGNYDLAWKAAVAIGLIAGAFQMTMNVRPTKRIEAERQALSRASAG